MVKSWNSRRYIPLLLQIGQVHHSLLRVLVMMIGELDYGSFAPAPKNDDESQDPSNPLHQMAFLFLFLCLALLSIALMNLMVRNWPWWEGVLNRCSGSEVLPGCLSHSPVFRRHTSLILLPCLRQAFGFYRASLRHLTQIHPLFQTRTE